MNKEDLTAATAGDTNDPSFLISAILSNYFFVHLVYNLF